jgi:hypothetical protein
VLDWIVEQLAEKCADRLENYADKQIDAGIEATFGALGLGLSDKAPAVDLGPVLESLSQILAQGSQVLEVLQRPTETAGSELCQRAATALAHDWFDDALRDAIASVAVFPYRATPYLIGALAAIRLGDPGQGIKLLVSCVKYSANGEPDVGAVAALVGAGIARATQLPELSIKLLGAADQITKGSCAPVVAALASLARDPSRVDRLLSLWWADEGVTTQVDFAAGWSRRISIPSTSLFPYTHTDGWFLTPAHEIVHSVIRLDRARKELVKQIARLESAVTVAIPVNERLDKVLRSRYGIKTPVYTAHSLKKTLVSVAEFDQTTEHPEAIFAYPEAKELADLKRCLLATQRTALLLSDLVTIGLESPKNAVSLNCDWQALGDTSKLLLIKLCAPGVASRWPGSHEDSVRAVSFHPFYSAALAAIVRETADGTLDEVVAATEEYESITARLQTMTPLALPADIWFPAPNNN